MDLFFMTLTNGIMVGGIYALVALGWVLIYKCSGVLNLAMGELTLVGAYVTWSFYNAGVPFVLAVFLTLVVGIILGILTERIFLDKLIGEPILAVIMVTVGLSFFLKGLVGFIYGTDTRVYTPPVFELKTDHHRHSQWYRRCICGHLFSPSCFLSCLCFFSNTLAGVFPCRLRPMMKQPPFPLA